MNETLPPRNQPQPKPINFESKLIVFGVLLGLVLFGWSVFMVAASFTQRQSESGKVASKSATKSAKIATKATGKRFEVFTPPVALVPPTAPPPNTPPATKPKPPPTPPRTPPPNPPPPPPPAQPPPPNFSVTAAVSSVAPTSSSECDQLFTFSGEITTDGAGTVTYEWEGSDGYLSGPQTLDFSAAGAQTVNDYWNVTSDYGAFSYWEYLLIEYPNQLTSNNAAFTKDLLNCP